MSESGRHPPRASGYTLHLPICMQPYMDLEAIVTLYRVLRDICAGAQVDLTIQFIRLKQEDPPRSTWAL